MRLLIVGGGSAGHVLPALPVIDAARRQGDEVTFVGTHTGLEESLVSDSGADFFAVSAGKLRRYWDWQNVTDLFRILGGVVQAFFLLGRVKPDVVFSKGGFVSFPVALAAWLRRVPVVAHESDITPGLANRLVIPFAATLCVSFAQTQVSSQRLRVVHTGTPLRAEILQGDPARGRQMLALESGKPLLVVTGGSLGADALNGAVRGAISVLTQRFDVLHVCGPGKLSDVEAPGYIQREYVSQGWGDMLAAADVVVSRAGANALFELLALGKLNLLVPLSARASRGDQLQNAAYAREQGYSAVLEEQDLTPQSLVGALDALLNEGEQYHAALANFSRVDAAGAIAAEIARASKH
jgi:UDP-N-acetylglucosamine--N-acetylmuramyl-(pentapeptide) pyrophosphoryl-undecaprenol N-acetylglucosamine transferase